MRTLFPALAILVLLNACARHAEDAPPTPESSDAASVDLASIPATPVSLAESVPGTAASNTTTQVAAVPELPLPEEWPLSPGLLRAQLEAWATRGGYQIVWKVSRDYYMQSASVFRGTFTDVLRQLFSGMQNTGNAFKIIVYQGNAVVVISEE